MLIKGFPAKTILFTVLCLSFLYSNPALAKECIDCHSDILKQLKGNSHHIQGAGISGSHCYACHWEATADGRINKMYHKNLSAKKTAKVKRADIDLVIWENGSRPTTFRSGVTAVAFRQSALGSSYERAEVAKVTRHCLGCHSDESNLTRPFAGDKNTPLAYAWDGQSVASRYSQKGVTTWGKYSTGTTNKKQRVVKAFSAHGNSTANSGGWFQANGYDGDMPNTRGGVAARNVECFDCHNSHGSSVTGVTSSYGSIEGKKNGGILKETVSGKNGYRMTYKPSVSAETSSQNPYNAGAGLCFDCHESAKSGATPWGYKSTFGAEEPIMGYKDTPGFGPGSKGSAKRFLNRHNRENIASSHLKAGKPLSHGVQSQIDGLCTPCHDPHGVSRTLGDNMPYALPLLKGTWLTSPYREDGPPSSMSLKEINVPSRETKSGTSFFYKGGGSPREPMQGMKYNVDRNTFGGENRITEKDDIFGGVCLKCHSQASLNIDSKSASVHRAVKGWGNNKEHSFPCSKCHQAHSSGLPRLMQTNCFEQGASGLRENSGVPWLPYNKKVDNTKQSDKKKSVPQADSRKIVGCHVKQFGGSAVPSASSGKGGTQWNQNTTW